MFATCNYCYTLWLLGLTAIDYSSFTDHLFSMGIKDLIYHLEGIVRNWFQLGVELGLPMSKLEEIECNNSSNVLSCKLLMLQEWQKQLSLKPSWCTLVDALHNMKKNSVAEQISQQFSKLCFGYF